MRQLKYPHLYLGVILFLWLGLSLDSVALAKHFAYGQVLTNLLAVFMFLWLYLRVSKVLKELMLFGVIVAFGGEILFSLVLGMYTYRLENLPLYVPLGHSLVYAAVYYIAKEPLLKLHKEQLIRFLYLLVLLYALFWLLFAGDVFGFVCTLGVFLLLRRYAKSRLFFLIMYFMIVYLELLGTHYGAWVWPEIWFNTFAFMPSANPPSGISLFYFGFDAGCLWFYKHYNKKRWERFRVLRRLREKA